MGEQHPGEWMAFLNRIGRRRAPSGSLSLAKSPEGLEEDGSKPGVNPWLIEYPGDVFAESVIAQTDYPNAAPTQTERTGEIVKYLCDFDRH